MLQQNSDIPAVSRPDFGQLKPSCRYRMHLLSGRLDGGATAPGVVKERIYLGRMEVGGKPFLEVARPTGREHLIAEEQVIGWEELA